jgi:hypothetical protein
MTTDKSAFERVTTDIERGDALTLEMVGDVFGKDFYILIITLLLDAQEAALAIQGSMLRLAKGEKEA